MPINEDVSGAGLYSKALDEGIGSVTGFSARRR